MKAPPPLTEAELRLYFNAFDCPQQDSVVMTDVVGFWIQQVKASPGGERFVVMTANLTLTDDRDKVATRQKLNQLVVISTHSSETTAQFCTMELAGRWTYANKKPHPDIVFLDQSDWGGHNVPVWLASQCGEEY